MALLPKSKQSHKPDGTWSRKASFRVEHEIAMQRGEITKKHIFHSQCGKNVLSFENSNTGIYRVTCPNCSFVAFIPKTLDTPKRCAVWNRSFHCLESFTPDEKRMEPIDTRITIDNGKSMYDSFVELTGQALVNYYKKFYDEGKIFKISDETGFYEIKYPEE